MGRAGRDGAQSVCVFLHRHKETMKKDLAAVFRSPTHQCLHSGLTAIFTISQPDGGFVR